MADGATADPAAEKELLDTARKGSFGELNRKAKARKAAALGDDEARARAAHRNRSFTTGTNALGEGWGRFNGPAHLVARLNAQLKPFLDQVFAQPRREGRRERPDAYAFDAFMAFAGLLDLEDLTGDGAGEASSAQPGQPARPNGAGGVDDEASCGVPDGSDGAGQQTGTPRSGDATRAGSERRTDSTVSNAEPMLDLWAGSRTAPDWRTSSTPASGPDRSGWASTDGPPAGPSTSTDADARDGARPGHADTSADPSPSNESGRRGPTAGPPADDPPSDRRGGTKPSAPPPSPGPPPTPPARRPTVRPDTRLILRVDATALRRGHTVAGETCDIAGLGPISVADLKALLPDAAIDVVITNGVDVFNVTHLGRRATARQQAVLDLLNIGCTRQGCNATQHLQVDHRVDWHKIKITELANLDWLCPHDHHLKTHEGWQLEPGTGKRPMRPPGEQPWLDAAGAA